jgi:hypothetical protein
LYPNLPRRGPEAGLHPAPGPRSLFRAHTRAAPEGIDGPGDDHATGFLDHDLKANAPVATA